MGIKFKQIDNLQDTFDNISGNLQAEITDNTNDVYDLYNSTQTLDGWKYFSNNVDVSGAQGLLVANDNIYSPNNLIVGAAKIGFSLSTPRNSTPAPLGSLQVTGGQIYFEDQLNVRNNSDIVITNGDITANEGIFDSVTGSSVNATYITGLTGNFLSLTGSDLNFENINTESIDFIPTTAPAHQEGRLFYDSDNLTLSLYNDEADVSLQLGQEEYLRVRNNTAGTISNGSAVLINGSQGTHPTINLASADSEEHAQVIGLATHDISSNSFGYVTTYGVVRGLNTIGYSAGDEVFLSTGSGAFTSGTIESPNYRVRIGHILRSHANQGTVLVQPGQAKLGGGDVKSLSTVNVSGINFYDSAADSAGILGSSSNFVYNNTSGFVGIGSSEPEGILDIQSTTSAPIMPRMTTAQMNAIASPIEGMLIYNTDSGKFAGYTGAWSLLH